MRFTIEVEVSRESGKFVSRDEIAEQLLDAVREADLSGLGADCDSEYIVDDATDVSA